MNKVSLKKINDNDQILRVGDLRRIIEQCGLSDDTPVLIERVEDVYFDGRDVSGFHGVLDDGTTGPLPEGARSKDQRPVVLRDSMLTHQMREHDVRVDSGFFDDKKNFPVPHPSHTRKNSQEEYDEFKDQFTTAEYCVVDNEGDLRALFIRLQY